MATTPNVFVFAATGTQGGPLARQLRAIGWEVHSTTRDVNSAAAQSLASIGVNFHAGDWSDEAALEGAITGCDLLFLNLMPDLSDITAEFETGKRVLRIAKAAGIKHVVYSGAISVQTPPDDSLNHYANIKLSIEKEVRALGFEYWTVLRPGYFMANLISPKVEFMYPGAAETGVFKFAFRPDTRLPMVDHEDIARFAVAAFHTPAKFHGKTIELVAENLTVKEAVEVLRRAVGRDIRAVYLSDEELQQALPNDLILGIQVMIRDMDAVGDVEGAKGWGIELGTFERFVAREEKAVQDTYRLVKD